MGKVLSNNERILFCEQMGMILKSGISAAEGIMIMKEDAGEEESSLRELYGEIQSNLEETGVFYDALEETEAFPDYMIQMTRIGEQTGIWTKSWRGWRLIMSGRKIWCRISKTL